MFNKLREFFLGLGSQSFEQDHNEAILTLLVWVMQADGKMEPSEGSKVSDFIASVNWNSPVSAMSFVLQAQKRVAQVEAGKLAEADLLEECAAKLETTEVRLKAYNACRELAKADNYLDDAERHLLELFAKTLLYAGDTGVP